MKTVLIVDDEFDILEALKTVLETEGYRVLTAADGKEGLDVIQNDPPDLVVADMMMPRMDGLELLQILHGTPQLSKIPVVLMSAMQPKVSQEVYGWRAFLHKPFEVSTLLEVIGANASDPVR